MNETWKTCLSNYEVSNCGNVRSPRRKDSKGRRVGGKILKAAPTPTGHKTVSLWINGKGRSYYVHRLVLEVFCGPCPKDCEASHINGDPSDNRIKNLCWESHKDNMNRSDKMGAPKGRKLSDEHKRKISKANKGNPKLAYWKGKIGPNKGKKFPKGNKRRS